MSQFRSLAAALAAVALAGGLAAVPARAGEWQVSSHGVPIYKSGASTGAAVAAGVAGGVVAGAVIVSAAQPGQVHAVPPRSYPAQVYGAGHAVAPAPVYVPRPGVGSVPGAVFISPPPAAIYAAPVPACRILHKRVYVEDIGWSWVRETACDN
ncbi:MAG: hypothetical protein ACOYOJ_04585 [Alsobacter sp.]